jgi:ADP-ribose pyrophosphatase
VVACYHRDGDRVSVLVREGLRPAMRFGRPGRASPFFCEVVAGILEDGDEDSEFGIRRRAAAEVAEEAGYAVTPEEVVLCGHTFPSPGSMPERFWLAVVEIRDPAAQRPLPGDGSPMEEDARTRWLDLDQAIASCVRGEIEDMKTELVLYRLRDRISAAASR